MRMKKIVALVLAFTMLASGLYIVKPNASEVKAETSSTADVPVDGMLDVKMQIQKNQGSDKYADGSVNLRLVSSVNGLGYSSVGFYIYLDTNDDGDFADENETITYRRGRVAKTIDDSVTKVAYDYSPKVIGTSSEYFITGTLMGINAKYLDNAMCVKAFCTTADGTKVWGTARYFTINTATAADTINIPVAMDDKPTTDESEKITGAVVKLDGTETSATLEAYDGKYAHLNIAVPSGDKTALPSACKVEVGDDSAIYRNLESTYAGDGVGDITWYEEYLAENPDETKFVIATAADLYGFANANTNFEGKTIYMVKDIEANVGRATEDGWLTTAEDGTAIKGATSYPWAPIGKNYTSETYNFAGTFDGQNHTISGVCLSKTGTANGGWGLFGTTGVCTIKNFTLANSNLSLIDVTNTANFGGIAGISNGFFDTIKVAEDVYLSHTNGSKEDYTGGIVGLMAGTVEIGSKISNCQFAGQITASDYVGGILACATDGTDAATTHKKAVEIENCLNNGRFVLNKPNNSTRSNCIGGICGTVNLSQIAIENSLNVATIDLNTDYSVNLSTTGTLIGWIRANYLSAEQTTDGTENTYTAIINNSYGISDGNWVSLGYRNNKGHTKIDGTSYPSSGNLKITSVFLATSSLEGVNGFLNTNLDFTIGDEHAGYWSTTATGTPVLSSFVNVEDMLELDEVTAARTVWYTKAAAGATEYTLYSMADMFGFASLTDVSFSGKTVKLGADITMNKGTADATSGFTLDAGEQTTLIPWTPRDMAGTFDGDGHTIKGVYLNSDTGNVGLFATVSGTVQDLILQNSYLNCNDKSADSYLSSNYSASIGSIAGTLAGGTLDTVYSDAIVKHAGSYAGGIVGSIYQDGTNKISNCCYAGEVEGYQGVGGLVGLVANTSATIEHCLNVGKVTGGWASGGLCGYVWNSDATQTSTSTKLTLTDSLNVGGFKSTDNNTIHQWVASIVGYARNQSKTYEIVDAKTAYGIWKRETDGEEVVVWKYFVYGSSRAQTALPDGTSPTGSVSDVQTYNLCNLTSILDKKTAAGTAMNLSFYTDGLDSSSDGETKTCWWVDRDGMIPMLESFEDLLTNVTY